MHTHEKLTFEPVTNFNALPRLTSNRVTCPQCQHNIPVPAEFTDWKKVPERYQEAYERMMRHRWENLKEAGEQFDVPLVEYFDADRQMLLALLEEIINKPTPPQ